jgi:hypothetical protein
MTRRSSALQFGLRLRAVKNSMKRRLVRSPQARIMASSASSLARTSTSGGVISSLSTIGGFAIIARKPARKAPFPTNRPRISRTDAILGQLGRSLVALLISRVCYAGFEQVLQLGWQSAMKLHRCAGDRVAKF